MFETYELFPSREYKRTFTNIVEAMEHVKTVVSTCGGSWEEHKNLEAWLAANVKIAGASVGFVCDPDLYKTFLADQGADKELSPVMQDFFDSLRGGK